MKNVIKLSCIKKYFLMSTVVLIVNALPGFAQKIPQPSLGPNLVKNAGFEDGAANWQIPSSSAEVTGDSAHNGQHSLFYNNTSAKQYKLFSQKVDVHPGQRLQFSAWVKGENIEGNRVSVFMQSYNSSEFIGGSYHYGIKGTFDWKQIKGEYNVPPNATETSVGLYLKRGATGKVWFDNVEVREVSLPPFTSSLLYPNYRGMIKQGEKATWEYQVQINLESGWKNEPVKIVTTLEDGNGKVLLQQQKSVPSSEKRVNLSLNAPRDLAVGQYSLVIGATDPNGEKYLVSRELIRVVEEMPKVYIDKAGFTVVDGKRFFPMGLYLHTPQTTDEHLARISKGGFNTILTYDYGSGKDPKAYMERAAKHDLKVVYSVKNMYPGKGNRGEDAIEKATGYIRMLHDNPSLLAWYINDELGSEWLPKLREMYGKVIDIDPNHPVFQVQDKLEMMPKHFDNTDILGADPYPVGNADLTKTSNNTRAAVDAAQGAKGVWVVPQIMDWHIYHPERKSHPPSLDELRNQAYQAIINGATGLIWYSYYDMMYTKSSPRNKSTENITLFYKRWPDAVSMAQEVNQIIPIVLANKKVTLDLPDDAEIEVGAWKDEDTLLLMLANPYYEEKSITFKLPEGWMIGNVKQDEIKSTFNNGQATFTLPSVGSGVFRLVKTNN